jgi:hypothetical protein
MRAMVTGETLAFLESSALLISKDSRIFFKEFLPIEFLRGSGFRKAFANFSIAGGFEYSFAFVPSQAN